MLTFDHLPIIDHHAHPFLARRETDTPLTFQRWFTESTDPTIERAHVTQTLLYRTSLRWLAEFVDCEPTVEAYLAARAAIPEKDLTDRLFTDVNIGAVLCDYGYGSESAYDHPAMQAELPCPVYPMIRMERLAEEIILAEPSFERMVERFTETLRAAPGQGTVAFKSIAAYRTGLAIGRADADAAKEGFRALRAEAIEQGNVRLAHKGLLDYLLHIGLRVATEHELPVQFHTGFGDADADLRWANPLHLRGIIEDYPNTQLVLLHAGWPFYREMAHLASLYANVWMDLSLAVPFATTGIPTMLTDVLGMAPFSKILFATDAFTMPEIYWVAARWGRWGLTKVLNEFWQDGFLTETETMQAGEDILGGNAKRLYGV